MTEEETKPEEETKQKPIVKFSAFLSGIPYDATEDDIKLFVQSCGTPTYHNY